jgi:hypothetical protein
MSEDEAPKRAIVFVPRPETVEARVRRLAAKTVNIKWSNHALARMNERGISDKFAVDALRNGSQRGPAEGGSNIGEWKIKMVYQTRGRREVGVVVITVRDAYLLVKTVEWEDLA